jgi:hypothetical protein
MPFTATITSHSQKDLSANRSMLCKEAVTDWTTPID